MADATGTSLEEVAASMMMLANSGLRASTIGTGLRQIFSRLVAPSSKLKEAFAEHNIELEDLNIRTHGFAGVLENLTDIFYDFEKQAIDSGKATRLFGLRGANAIIALMKAVQSGDFQTALKSVFEVGTAAKMASIQIEGLALKVKNMTDKAKNLAIAVGESGLSGVLGTLIDAVRTLTEFLTEVAKTTTGKIGLALTGLTVGLSALALVGMGLGKVLSWLTGLLGTFFIAVKGHPLTWLVLAVSALTTAFMQWRQSVSGALRQSEDLQVKLAANVKSLESYEKRLNEANEAMQKNKSESFRYEAVLERLKKDHEDLGKQIDKTNKSHKEVIKLVREARFEEARKEIKQSIITYQELQKATADVKGFAGMRKAWEGFLKWLADATQTYLKFLLWWWNLFFGGIIYYVKAGWEKLFNFFKKYGEGTEDVKKHNEEMEKSLEGIIDSFVRLATKFEIPTEKLKEEMTKMLTEMKMNEEKIALVIDAVLKKLAEIGAKTRKPIKIDIAFPIEDFFKEAQPYQYASLMNLDKQMKSQVTALKSWADKNKDIHIDVSRSIGATHGKMYLEMIKGLDDSTDFAWEKTLRLKNRIDDLQKQVQAYFATKRSEEEEKFTRIKVKKGPDYDLTDEIKEKKATLDTLEQMELGALAYLNKEKDKLNAVGITGMLTHEEELRRLINERGTAQQVREVEERVANRIMQEREGTLEILRIKQDGADMEVAYQERALKKLKALKEKDAEDVKAAEERLDAAREAARNARTARIQGESANWLYHWQQVWAHAEEYYQSGEMSAEKYFEYVSQARFLDLIDEEEYQDQRIRLQENGWENLKRGFQKAARASRDFNKMWQQIGEQLPETIADRFTTMFEQVIDGTKEAGQAFRDFAADILRWLSKIIMKQMILNAISGWFGAMAGTPAVATAGGGNAGTAAALTGGGGGDMLFPMPPLGHKGGIAGSKDIPVKVVNPGFLANALRFHNGGLASDEVPAVLQKGEGVFTKAQMKALGNTITTTINVPVNVESGSQRLASRLRQNVEDVVKQTLRQEMR
jgi:hypothetical protein